MKMKKTSLLHLFCVSFIIYSVSASSNTDLEATICGGIKEPFVFWMWSNLAGKPNPDRLKSNNNIKDVSINTRDGKVLRGYKLKSRNEAGANGYILVSQGNAMLADQIIDRFSELSRAGFDVYIFDYRGYGRSEGKRRFKAILNDYRQIKDYLDSLRYGNRAFYGMSFGGVVLLDVLKDDKAKKMVIIDSAPSTLSDYGCPLGHDPINNILTLSGESLFIFGEKDKVVTREMSMELSKRAKDIGKTLLIRKEFGHPFMDGHNARRMNIIRGFLEKHQTR